MRRNGIKRERKKEKKRPNILKLIEISLAEISKDLGVTFLSALTEEVVNKPNSF